MARPRVRYITFFLLIITAALYLGSCGEDTQAPEQTPPTAKGWVIVNTPVDSLALNSVWGNGPDTVVAVGDSGTVLSYNGAVWTLFPKLTNENLNSVSGNRGDNVYAVGNNRTVLHFDGTAWSQVTTSHSGDLTGVFVAGDGAVLVCRADGHIGSALNEAPCGYVGSFLSAWINDAAVLKPDYYATAADGFVSREYRTAQQPVICSGWSVCGQALNAMWGFSGSNIVVVGDAGTIYRYDGADWTAMTSGTSENLRGVWGRASNFIYAVGDNGAIIHYNGAVWAADNSGTTADLRAVFGVSDKTIFAVGENGIVLRRDF